MTVGNPLSAQIFSLSRAERVALARQRFFEDGERPSGLVPEPVIQSWGRMSTARNPANTQLSFNPVSASRMHGVLARNRQLLEVASDEIAGMEAALSGTGCRVLLTDGKGVIVHATHDPSAARALVLPKVGRVGVILSEDSIGTSAPSIAVKTGSAAIVSGAEHFYDCMQSLRCAAVPIRNVRGELAGVLDLSVEGDSFPFDAAAFAGMYATSIENRLLQAQGADHLLLHFQSNPALLRTPLAGLAGIDTHGRVAWLNQSGAALLGCTIRQPHAETLHVDGVLGQSLAQLLALVRAETPQWLRLPCGLGLWALARAPAHDGFGPVQRADWAPQCDPAAAAATGAPAASTSSPATPDCTVLAEPGLSAEPCPDALRARAETTFAGLSRQLIEQALEQAGGNISRAARRLGVSRGLLYRRLQRWRADPAE